MTTTETTTTILAPGGEGAYGLRYDATTLRQTATGRYVLGFDLWCGDSVEGQCYRRFVMEVTEAEAGELASQAADSASWISDWINKARYEGVPYWRVSRAPVWMRRFAS